MDNVPPEIAVLIMMHGRMRPSSVPTKKWMADMMDPQLLRTHMFHRDERYITVDDAAAVAMAIELGHNDVLHHFMLCGKVRDPTLLGHALMHSNIEAADMLYERGSRASCRKACKKAVMDDNEEVVDWALARGLIPAMTVLTDAVDHVKERFAQKAFTAGLGAARPHPLLMYKGAKARMDFVVSDEWNGAAYIFAVEGNDIETINWLYSKGVKPAVPMNELMMCSEETALAVLRAGNVSDFQVVLRIVRAGLATLEELVDIKRHMHEIVSFLA